MKADKKLKLKVRKGQLKDSIGSAYQASSEKFYRPAKSKKAKKTGSVVLAVFLCFAVLFCIFNINYLTPYKMKEHLGAIFSDMGKGEGFPYRFSSNEVLDFFAFNGKDYVVLTNSELIILNKSASPVLTYHHSMSNPIAKYSRDRILLFDQGGTKAVVLNQSGQIISFPIKGKLLCGAISDSGKTVIAQNINAQEQEVFVYSNRGKELMNWKKGSGYIIDVSLNNAGSLLCVGIIDTTDAVKTTNVLNFNVGNAKQISHTVLKDAILYGVKFINGNNIAVLSKKNITILNSKCVVVKETDLPAESSSILRISDNGYILNVYSPYNNGKFNVDIYNSSLKSIFTEEFEGEIKNACVNSRSVAVLFEDNHAALRFFGAKKELKAAVEYDSLFIYAKNKNVYFCSNGVLSKEKAG